MKRISQFIGLAMVLVLIVSCTSFKFTGAQVNLKTPSYTVVGNFDFEVGMLELLGTSGGTNFLNLTSEVMDERINDAIRDEIIKQGGDAAIDVTITYMAGLLDMILNSLTVFILAPAVARVEGTVVSY